MIVNESTINEMRLGRFLATEGERQIRNLLALKEAACFNSLMGVELASGIKGPMRWVGSSFRRERWRMTLAQKRLLSVLLTVGALTTLGKVLGMAKELAVASRFELGIAWIRCWPQCFCPILPLG